MQLPNDWKEVRAIYYSADDALGSVEKSFLILCDGNATMSTDNPKDCQEVIDWISTAKPNLASQLSEILGNPSRNLMICMYQRIE